APADEPAEDAEPAGEGAEVEESGAAAEEPAAAAGAPEPATTPAPYRFERGRVAYIRCPGLEGAGGRCPRDRDLEESVWAALGGVAECAARPAAGGTADVRLTFSGGGAPELRFRDWGDSPLPSASLRACLASTIAPLRTSLRADPLVISFRFRFRE
ncbi:MAG TPA: hypothetical protein RMG95_12125, partial [Polyangiaceae bacterium LLY-WYZ-15_(1-7)]|nr:hypothetical protein [Sandaracinus sp.]HJL36422.1 hypothetical protein [Polyangiaceae bacterium LLY-WYZ-15_(1-7)]